VKAVAALVKLDNSEHADPEATAVAAAVGMSVAERHANKVWKHFVRHTIRKLAESQPVLTSDDVRIVMRADHPTIQTHNKSALGPLLTAAAKKGWIESNGRMRSELPVTHGKWITTWRSHLYADLPD